MPIKKLYLNTINENISKLKLAIFKIALLKLSNILNFDISFKENS